jgi:hypothetical protein
VSMTNSTFNSAVTAPLINGAAGRTCCAV